jgi:dihydroorotate dehydrogenase, subfamily 2
MSPEQAHETTILALRLAGSLAPGRLALRCMFPERVAGPQVEAFGLKFANPLGMAAGYDKNGVAWRGLAGLGFGHVEIGTVTPLGQPGNPKPRSFRLVEDQALINRMGFNNHGAEYMARQLQHKRPQGLILGVNIGKNKVTPNERAVEDYLTLTRTFAPLADYLAVNVSSPNTPNLRQLQTRKALEELLAPLAAERDRLQPQIGRHVPILVKLAPDLADDELDGALEAVSGTGMDGLIISNTTINHSGLRSPLDSETGGMSGAPLCGRNTRLVEKVVKRCGGKLPVVASGGVMNAADAQAKLDAGAVLVQLYTGLIYEGPGLVREILNAGLNVY